MIFADWIYLYVGLGAIAFIILLSTRARLLKKKALAKFISPNLLAQLSYNHSRIASQVKFLLLIVGVAFVFTALARPQWGFAWQETKSKGTDIIFAIDCSKSMLSDDIKPNRLDRAKLAIEDALSYVEGDRIGIVAFSGIAFLQCPLTLDYNAFKMSLKDIDTNLIDRGGTNISAALMEAESAFKSSTGAKNIILLSDGEELEADALSKAKSLAEEGVKIYTLGVGDTKLAPLSYTDSRGQIQYLKDLTGNIVESKLDEERLMEIANSTGAFYSRLDANAMQRVLEEVQKEKQELSSKMKRSAIERYQIFLAIALVLLCLESLVGTRKLFVKKVKNIALNKMGGFLLFALCAGTLAQDLQAQDSPRDIFNEAVLAEESGESDKALQLYTKAMQGEYEDMLLHAKAQYNMGNIEYKKAREAYAKIENIDEILQAMQSASSEYDNAKSQGEKLLNEGNYRLIDDLANGTNNLEEQGFQDSLKQSVQGLEALLKTSEEFLKAKTSKLEGLKGVQSQLQKVENLYNSASQLAPQEKKLAKNLESAKVAKSFVSKEEDTINTLSQEANTIIAESKTALPKLIEDLKKLIKDDENQDSQDNQENQQNQDSQENQESQDSQDSQENQNSQDNQENQQDNQDSQQEQNQEEQAVDNSQENQGSQGNQEQEANQQEEQGESQDGQSQDEQNSEQSQGEQASAQEAQGEQAEQIASASEEAQVAEEDSQDYRVREGAMTKREALQLLEATEGNEKHLPYKGFGTSTQRYNQNYKDW